MDAKLPLELRRKYGLVHVPSRTRVERWISVVHREIGLGVPAEAAGLQAAREVFPYEAREVHEADLARVAELLVRGDSEHPL